MADCSPTTRHASTPIKWRLTVSPPISRSYQTRQTEQTASRAKSTGFEGSRTRSSPSYGHNQAQDANRHDQALVLVNEDIGKTIMDRFGPASMDWSSGNNSASTRNSASCSEKEAPCALARHRAGGSHVQDLRPSTPASTRSSPETRQAQPEAPARAWITAWLATALWGARFAKPLSTPTQPTRRSQKGDAST